MTLPGDRRLRLAAAALVTFAVLGVCVLLGWTAAIDAAVVRLVFGRRAATPTTVALSITSLGGPTLVALATLLAAAQFRFAGRRGAMLAVVAAPLGAWLSETGLKALFGRPRPAGAVYLIPGSFAFPSGHAAAAAALYLTLGLLLAEIHPIPAARRFTLATAASLPVLIAASRVYLGVHYLSDVIGGLLLGSAWALGVVVAVGDGRLR